MQFPISEYGLWVFITLLRLVVCALALRHRLFGRLPFFTSYLVLATTREILFWWLYHHFGYHSATAFYAYWLSQAILVAARAAAIAELAWRAVREYRGIWALAWRLLCGIALLVVLSAAVEAGGNASRLAAFIITAERGLELAAVAALVSLFGFCRYYRIHVEPVQKTIALGLGFYSAAHVLNDSVMQGWLTSYFKMWDTIRMVSFQVALVIWLIALRKPLPDMAPAPALLPQKVYDELSPQINYRLRALNQRLLEIFKS